MSMNMTWFTGIRDTSQMSIYQGGRVIDVVALGGFTVV